MGRMRGAKKLAGFAGGGLVVFLTLILILRWGFPLQPPPQDWAEPAAAALLPALHPSELPTLAPSFEGPDRDVQLDRLHQLVEGRGRKASSAQQTMESWADGYWTVYAPVLMEVEQLDLETWRIRWADGWTCTGPTGIEATVRWRGQGWLVEREACTILGP